MSNWHIEVFFLDPTQESVVYEDTDLSDISWHVNEHTDESIDHVEIRRVP
jgi:hypothetical protein